MLFTKLYLPFEKCPYGGNQKRGGMANQSGQKTAVQASEPVGAAELNEWKRGFTPQAEIWNGRLAMIGLSAGLAVLLVSRVFNAG
jgi:hypothetical protein